ncbi:MAG TPA: hypothetical protein VI935_03070 [Thermodesulfobacteriota bacterium]|nr:hypothetical protein [Thermodesulfobacteriota bacterium]
MSFYSTPQTANTTALLITADQKSDDEYISVFGVQITRSSRLKGELAPPKCPALPVSS